MTSYTDNIKVKISEKYKPPPRISLAVTYAQRLKLNKQIQDNMPNYNFSTEMFILDKMKEKREKKLIALQERQSKLEIKRQKLDEIKKKALEDTKMASVSESLPTSSSSPTSSTSVAVVPPSDMSNIQYTMSNTNMLIPTQINDYSNILKPVQLNSYGTESRTREPDKKSAFKLSDFEDDTSSPFDNVELKSINDLEQLAQVLNHEDHDQRIMNKDYSYLQSNVHNFPTDISQSPQSNYNTYLPKLYTENQYLPNIPSAMPCRSNNPNYVYSNGYSYPNPMDYTQTNPQYQTPYTWTKVNNDYISSFQYANVDKSNCKSVPDIVNAIEVELKNTHLTDSSYSQPVFRNKSAVNEIRPKSTEDVSVIKRKSQDEESLLKFLTKDEQELCKSISTMGFPIERVARVFRLLGNDQKKIVEHLLAMSELLDLGFHEKDVSNALFECDNDRDKALDKLIT